MKLFHALAQAVGLPAHVLIDSSAVKAHRSAVSDKGEQSQAIGRSRSGRSTKIHALTDRQCRPIAFLLTGGPVADCEVARKLLEHLPSTTRVLHSDQRLRREPYSATRGSQRQHAEYPAQGERGLEELLLACALSGSQRN